MVLALGIRIHGGNQYCDNYMEDVYSALWAAVKHCCPLSTAILIKSGAVIYGVDQLLVLNDERTADPKCVNCSCLAVKAQLLLYKTNSVEITTCTKQANHGEPPERCWSHSTRATVYTSIPAIIGLYLCHDCLFTVVLSA